MGGLQLQLGRLDDHKSGYSEYHVLFSQDSEEDNVDVQESPGLIPVNCSLAYVKSQCWSAVGLQVKGLG